MIQTYTHTFKFQTQDSQDIQKLNNNTLSIVEEDANKHYIQYIQYQTVDSTTILSREVNISVDRLYYLEIANIAIDDVQRRKRLFTVIGKRCFGNNNNKLDPYLLNKEKHPKTIYNDFIKQENSQNSPILHELITHTINKYEAYPFISHNSFYVVMKQVNISKRKTFEKIFLVEMNQSDYRKLLAYTTNELKIEFIFNVIGKIFFKSKTLTQSSMQCIDCNPQNIIHKAQGYIEGKSLNAQSFFSVELFTNLKSKHLEMEKSYFNLLGKSVQFISEPDDDDTIFLFSLAITNYIELFDKEPLLQEVVSFLQSIQFFAQEKKISYLMQKDDHDIEDIFLFVLEAITSWNASLHDNETKIFAKSTLDLYNALKYFIDIYFQHYYDYKSIDATKNESATVTDIVIEKDTATTIENTNPKISAKEFFSDVELDMIVLDELEELESDIQNSINIESFDATTKKAADQFLNGYIKMLNIFYEFKELAFALALLNEKLSSLDIVQDSSMLVVLFESIVNDLIEWKQSVFIEQNAEDIHYMDQSFYANIAQIEVLFNSDGGAENEIDFF